MFRGALRHRRTRRSPRAPKLWGPPILGETPKTIFFSKNNILMFKFHWRQKQCCRWGNLYLPPFPNLGGPQRKENICIKFKNIYFLILNNAFNIPLQTFLFKLFVKLFVNYSLFVQQFIFTLPRSSSPGAPIALRAPFC